VSEEEEEEVPISSETSRENDVVKVYEPMIPYPQRLIEVAMEHEDSLPKDLMENHEEEMEEDNPGGPHLIEAGSCIEEGLMELPMQKAFAEDKTPIITQQPCLEIKEVKATNNNTEERIVTKLPLSISRKKERSTTNNSPSDPTSKLNSANNKRKLAEERPRQGTLAGSSLPLRSFLLTNWKKSKKVKNKMSS